MTLQTYPNGYTPLTESDTAEVYLHSTGQPLPRKVARPANYTTSETVETVTATEYTETIYKWGRQAPPDTEPYFRQGWADVPGLAHGGHSPERMGVSVVTETWGTAVVRTKTVTRTTRRLPGTVQPI